MQTRSAQLLPQVTTPIGTKTHDGHCQVKSPFVPLTVQQQRSKPADDGASPDQPRLSPSTTKLVKRPGRGWTLAISLSFAMAAGARDAQSAPTRSVGGRAAAHSTERQPALEQSRAIARIRTCRRGRTRCAQRHSSGKRTICPATRHARRGNAAEIERLGPRRNGYAALQGQRGQIDRERNPCAEVGKRN